MTASRRLAAACLALLLSSSPGGARRHPTRSTQLHRIYSRRVQGEDSAPPVARRRQGSTRRVEPAAAAGDNRARTRPLRRGDRQAPRCSFRRRASFRRPAARRSSSTDYTWSADGKKLLIFTNTRKVWRKNTRGDYWVLDVDAGKLHASSAPGKPEASLMFAKFSPDATRVAYVQENDLWVEELASRKGHAPDLRRSPTIINGTSDWVYEEEFELRDGFRWSPDGQDIAFWRFDSSGIGEFSLINDTDTLYPVVTQHPVSQGRHHELSREGRDRVRRGRRAALGRAAGRSAPDTTCRGWSGSTSPARSSCSS